MNKQFFGLLVFLGIGTILFFAVPPRSSNLVLKDDREKASYAFGLNLGEGLRQRHSDLDAASFKRGVADALADRGFLLSPTEMQTSLPLVSGTESGIPEKLPIISFFKPFKYKRLKASYAFGVDIGLGWKKNLIDLSPELVIRGIRDAMSESAALLTSEEANATMIKYGHELMRRQEIARKKQGLRNKKAGEGFLAKNKLQKDVVTLSCGLQYQVMTEGTGNSPEPQNFVILKYRGTRIDGSVFDTSDASTKPMIFPMGGMLRAWSEAVPMMKEGAKWRIFVPAEEGYGEDGSSNIGPNEILIYDLELVKILPGQPEPTPMEKASS